MCALQRFSNLVSSAIFHVRRVDALGEFVNHDTIGKLNSETIVIDGDVFDVILVLDSHFLSRTEMLYDHICHAISIRISLSIDCVHCLKGQIVPLFDYLSVFECYRCVTVEFESGTAKCHSEREREERERERERDSSVNVTTE